MAAADRALGGALGELESSGEFRGEKGELALVHTRGARSAKRLLLAGLGPAEGVDLERIRVASAAAARRARAIRVKNIAFLLPEPPAGADLSRTAQAVTEAALFGLHQFNEYRLPDEKRVPVNELRVGAPAARPEVADGVKTGEIIGSAVLWAKEMALHPGNVLTPARLADEARSLAGLPGMTVEVHDRAWIEEMKMGGVVAVTQGSHHPPRFIVMRYRPRTGGDDRPVVLIGKGVTFDSGG